MEQDSFYGSMQSVLNWNSGRPSSTHSQCFFEQLNHSRQKRQPQSNRNEKDAKINPEIHKSNSAETFQCPICRKFRMRT